MHWGSQRLDRRDWQLLLKASLLVPILAVALRLFGFRRVFHWLKVSVPDDERGTATGRVERLRKIIRIIKLRGVYRGNCLSRSLTLWWLLRRKGVQCELIIGSRFRDGRFQAHAWIEIDGTPVNASPRVRQNYQVFADHPEFHRGLGTTTVS